MAEFAELELLLKEATDRIKQALHTEELEAAVTGYLGRKGELTGQLRKIATLPKEQKKDFGQRVNQIKDALTALAEARREQLADSEKAARLQAEAVDVTLPGRLFRTGHTHIMFDTIFKVKEVFAGMGYEIVEGPEIEYYKYNFEVLNYPPEHPAMDEQMSFYITDERLLRTQTTAYQGRQIPLHSIPMKVCTVGKCYRRENVDATHGHTFHQVDCFCIDKGISMADLKGTLQEFASQMFGKDVKVRFRPDFFPFVEPGAEIAISCVLCGGKGCNVCKGSGWLELGGAGMIHENILTAMGIDPNVYSGFAFGLGIERTPMLQRGIKDLRLFTENDLRFLRQL
ncbi:MAG: phenylalanine--tRNA ligase subunit alpha [Abditibacteriota bacterium]|nr:phenylalanine--tRNA ligase subunit alpha [Abditibacteriota bacterium]